MKTIRYLSCLACFVAVLSLARCSTEPKAEPRAEPTHEGFLGDYSRLKPTADGALRYINPTLPLAGYSGFIIEPVVVRMRPDTEGRQTDPSQLRRLAAYMRSAIIEAIEDRYSVVTQPGPGVARVRVALTDVRRSIRSSSALRTLLEGGQGGAAMEAELIDSRSGRQIAALIESRMGDRLSFVSSTAWDDTRAIMDEWAGRLRKRLDEASEPGAG